MTGRLEGKVAIITGAGAGIGAATARLFAREGARVVAIDLRAEMARVVADAIAAAGGACRALAGDVTRRADAERWLADTLAAHGRVDVLVNSAGVTPRNAPADWDWERVWDWVMEVNVKGSVIISRLVAEAMVTTGGGAIVNLASIYGLVGRAAGISIPADPYSHSKGAVVQLTREMAVHYASRGVRVNALCPGFVYTDLTRAVTENQDLRHFLEERHPMGRLAQPDEIARAALFLASDDASFVTGVCLPVDGGYTAQ